MFFQKRIDRAMKLSEERKNREPVCDKLTVDENSNQTEKGDLPAMIISALLVFIPAALAVLLIMAAISVLLLRI